MRILLILFISQFCRADKIFYDPVKIVGTSPNHVIINNNSGTLASEQSLAILRGGTGQSTATAGFGALSPLTTKGDLIVFNGSSNARLPVGANNFVLTADASTATGVKWSVISASSMFLNITTKTADYTASASDDVILCNTASNAITITLPTAVGNSGKVLYVKTLSDNFSCVIDANGSQTIDSELTQTLIALHASVTMVSDGSNWYIL